MNFYSQEYKTLSKDLLEKEKKKENLTNVGFMRNIK